MATYLPNVTDIFPQPSLFTPNFSFMDQMLRRRHAMYEQGFAQVNNAYGFINRPVTHGESAKVRDQFIKQAKDNLKDLSAMDLSQQQNVIAAKSVFEPFVKNGDVLGDMALTAHWDQQESVAESFRLTDNGKEFSEDNINYVRMQRDAFARGNLSDWKGYYANRRSYTPYYDWNKEMRESFKDFKPSNVKIERRAGLYNITETDKSAKEQDIKRYLLATLSDKAKNQMRIEAAVRYGSNVEGLAGYYKEDLKKDSSMVTDAIRSLDNQISLTNDYAKKKQLAEVRSQMTDKLSDLETSIKKIDSGDVDYVRRNSEQIAFSLYFNNTIDRMSKGLSYTDYERTIDGDDVAMMMWKDGQEWARARYNNDRADAREMMKLEGLNTPMDKITLPGDMSGVVLPESIPQITEQMNSLRQVNANLSEMLQNHVALALGKPASQITEKDINDYAKSEKGQADGRYMNYKRAISGVQIETDMLEANITAAETYAQQKLGPKFDEINKLKTDFGKRKPVRGITAAEMLEAVGSGKAKLEQDRDEAGRPMSGLYTLDVNGRKFSVNKGFLGVGADPLLKLYNEAQELQSNTLIKDYQNSVNQYFGDSRARILPGFVNDDNSKTVKFTKGKLSSIVGQDPTKITGIVYGGNNDAYFGIEGDKVNRDAVVTSLQQLGLDAKYVDKIGRFYVKEKPGISKMNLGLDMYGNYNPIEKKLITYGQTYAGHNYTSPYFYPGDITKDKNGNPMPQFKYKVQVAGDEKLYYLYSELDPSKPIRPFNSLTDLMDAATKFAENPNLLVPFIK